MNNKVYRVKEDVSGPLGIDFKKGQELQIVRGMVYMGGFPVSPGFQKGLMEWVSKNTNLLIDIT